MPWMGGVRGILPPLVTPFLEDGALDLEAFTFNLEAYAQADLAGYLVLGSNGEAPSLDESEKLRLVEAARRSAHGRLLLVGTGCESTRATIALTRKVADAGADAALVITPSYYRARMTEEALRRHFEAIAEASPIPILLYSVPVVTGLVFPAGLAVALAEHPRVVGIKESSGDMALMGRLVGSLPQGFSVICGSAPVIYPALCLGARAGILAIACCAPAAAAALFRAFAKGDHDGARRIQAALAPLATSVTATHGVAGLKAAMSLAGLRGGAVRSPLQPVSEPVRGEIERLLAEMKQALAQEPGLSWP